jgi:hypothetical protein
MYIICENNKLYFFIGYFSLFTVQILSPFQVFLSETFYKISPSPAFMRVLPHPPTLVFLLCHSLIPGHRIPSGPRASLPTDPNKAILCHICSLSHGSLLVYSLVGSPDPRSSGVSGKLTLLLPPLPTHGATKPLSSFRPFSNSSIR